MSTKSGMKQLKSELKADFMNEDYQNQNPTQEQNLSYVLQPFQESFMGYLMEIDNLYKQSLQDYEVLLNEHIKGLGETDNELNDNKDRILIIMDQHPHISHNSRISYFIIVEHYKL